MTGTFYNRMTLTLAAGETRQVNAYGRYFRILGNTIATDPMVIIGDQAGEQKVSSGLGLELPIDPTNDNSFARLLIRNPAGSQMVLDIAISSGKIDDSRLSVSGSINVQDGGGSLTVDNADLTAAAASVASIDTKATDLKLNTRCLNGDTGTQITKSGAATNGVVTIHTVTTGKTFYLTSINLSCACTTQNGAIVEAWNGGASLGRLCILKPAANSDQAFSTSYPKPIKYSAGIDIKLTVDPTAVGYACITGWEE